MKIYTHCGNFKTLKEAKERRSELIKKFRGKVIQVRKRQTSIDKLIQPYEVVMVEEDN